MNRHSLPFPSLARHLWSRALRTGSRHLYKGLSGGSRHTAKPLSRALTDTV